MLSRVLFGGHMMLAMENCCTHTNTDSKTHIRIILGSSTSYVGSYKQRRTLESTRQQRRALSARAPLHHNAVVRDATVGLVSTRRIYVLSRPHRRGGLSSLCAVRACMFVCACTIFIRRCVYVMYSTYA